MSRKILLVDDIPMFLEVQKNMLQRLPVRLATAADGHEALRLVEQFQPDLVVLDASMPRMDGIACCRALKEHREHRCIPVIMTLSGFGCDEGPCRAAGCEAVLRKPLDTASFLDAVTAFVPDIGRRGRRIPLLAPVTLRTGGRTFGGALVNISSSGACVEPDEKVELGAALDLTLQLTLVRRRTLELRGNVVRMQPPNSNGMHAGIGVAFAASAHLRNDLQSLVEAR